MLLALYLLLNPLGTRSLTDLVQATLDASIFLVLNSSPHVRLFRFVLEADGAAQHVGSMGKTAFLRTQRTALLHPPWANRRAPEVGRLLQFLSSMRKLAGQAKTTAGALVEAAELCLAELLAEDHPSFLVQLLPLGAHIHIIGIVRADMVDACGFSPSGKLARGVRHQAATECELLQTRGHVDHAVHPVDLIHLSWHHLSLLEPVACHIRKQNTIFVRIRR
mmetsp:Transcript_34851/g.80270  ORF Transcript_34851/g.80270 Transcript_34851/m.80270 type:complete len:221 (+) Transcript_34851:423-1085(+)